jgi:hypothetical protein
LGIVRGGQYMFSISSLFFLLSTTCSIVLQHILLLFPCGQQHPPLLASLATYASANHFLSLEVPHKKHIPWKNSHTLCMKCTCVAVFKISYQVHLSGLLEGKQGSALHAQGWFLPVTGTILDNLVDKTLKWCLPDQ